MLTLAIKIIAVSAMIIFIFIGIWGFILLIKIFDQLRYKNYLMEKLVQNTYRLNLNNETKQHQKNDVELNETKKFTEKEILDINIKKDAI